MSDRVFEHTGRPDGKLFVRDGLGVAWELSVWQRRGFSIERDEALNGWLVWQEEWREACAAAFATSPVLQNRHAGSGRESECVTSKSEATPDA